MVEALFAADDRCWKMGMEMEMEIFFVVFWVAANLARKDDLMLG